MADAPRHSLFRPFLIAVVVTLGVLALRLHGELEQWDPRYFSPEPGGKGALVGITWLVPVLGFWFGRRLAQSGSRPARPGRALLLHLLGFALAAGLAFGAMAVIDDIDLRAYVLWIGFPVMSLIALVVWPRAFLVNLAYGIVARGAVLGITHHAFGKPEWKTHFTALPPDEALRAHLDTPAKQEFFVSMAQIVLWIPFTILVGGFFAVLGAMTVRRAA